MKPRSSRFWAGGVVSAASFVLLLATGCGTSEQPQVGSQTNWLKACDSSAECGEDLDCLCGTCTVTCETDATCDDFGSSSCVTPESTGAVALCSGSVPAASLCLSTCEEDSCPNGSVCMAGVCAPSRAPTAEVVINTDVELQSLIGFGASLAFDEDFIVAHPDKAALYDAMFRDSGFELIRVRNRWDGDNPEALLPASEILSEAESRMADAPLVFLTSGSPPATLKANGERFCGQSDPDCTLARDMGGAFDYAGYAEYWRSAVEAYEAAGVTPTYLSLQSNADWLPSLPEGGEACRFLPEEGTMTVTLPDDTTVDAEFPGYVEALAAVIPAVATLGGDYIFTAPEAGSVVMVPPYTDALDAGTYGAISYHMFGTDAADINVGQLEAIRAASETSGHPSIQSEMAADGLHTAILIHHALVTAGSAAYIAQQFVSQDIEDEEAPLIGADDTTFTIQPPYHSLTHFSLHTGAGWTRVETESSAEEILASAWVSPDESSLTLVFINTSDADADVRVTTPGSFDSQLESALVTRTVFGGVERSSDLGALPADRILRLPAESIASVTLSNE